MAEKECSKCGQLRPLDQFVADASKRSKRKSCCKPCRNAYLRDYNVAYTKTKKGFLMRLYRNMKSRIKGVQKQKFHLYAGKTLAMTKEEFYEWGFTSAEFHELFAAWEASGYARQYTPSVDRVDSTRGYEFNNMEWVTHSENSRRGSLSQRRSHSRSASIAFEVSP